MYLGSAAMSEDNGGMTNAYRNRKCLFLFLYYRIANYFGCNYCVEVYKMAGTSKTEDNSCSSCLFTNCCLHCVIPFVVGRMAYL
jgi:hypothetical protein